LLLCDDDTQIRAIEDLDQNGIPLNTAAGQKPQQDINAALFRSSFSANVPASSVGFGFTATSAPSFGTNATNVFPGHGGVFSTPASAFGPSQQSGPFADAAASVPFSQPQTTTGRVDIGQSHADNVAINTHTPLGQLSADDRAQFEAQKFTLGRIPVRPPPTEFV